MKLFGRWVFAFLETKNNGMNEAKQTKHEHLGGETFRVLNISMHNINYSNVF